MDFKRKFAMSKEDNIFFAKRNIVDSIWKEARVEGVNVTFPETYSIYAGINVPSLSVRDITVINNLKHCWQFVLDTLDVDLSLRYICQVNKEVGSAGEVRDAGLLRTSPVNIGGTTWMPNIPNTIDVLDDIDSLNAISNPTERAIRSMLYLMRSQLFNDGNKRTAQLVANKIMIENGCGIIAIPEKQISQFSSLLIDFYESNISEPIANFIYNECVLGMNFDKEIEPRPDIAKTAEGRKTAAAPAKEAAGKERE